MEMNTTDRYSERIRYDKNSNVSNVARYGMNNLRSYGVIDSLEITRNGNQLVAIEDHAEKDLTYTGASDFVDGTDLSEEYTYDGNGRLTKDTNRGIGSITYDPCNNPQSITFTGTNGIEYAYASDGTKLRTVHKVSGIGGTVTRDTTDYLGNLVMRNRHLGMCRFEGGYVSFDNDTIDGWHYYIHYMGNNRMVVNSDGTIEQVTHYYPYGGVIGDISTNENLQKYKFEGKELDRTFGLDNYDIHARQYFAMAPMWDRIDPLTEDNPQFSPYSYCFGNPVNYGDYDGFIPSVYAAALMSALAYGEDNNDNYKEYQKDLNRQDWYTSTLIDNSVLSDFWTGLECVLFEHRLGNGEVDEYVLAFAGTDPLSAIDWVNDIEQIYGNSPQYDLAISIAKDVNIIVEGFELTYVGHSLGGGETTAASMATGNHGITFNSAAVSDETLERNGIDPSMPANVDNYVASGIRIPFTNTRIGGDIVNNLQGKAGLHLRGNIHEVYTGPIPTHTKDTMIKALHQKDLRQVF